jgi:methionyl-tRNA formyltransferase
MRIEFLTQNDPVYVFPFFDEFVRHFAHEFEITQISACPAMGRRSRTQMVRELIQLYGFRGATRLVSRLLKCKIFGALPRKPHAKNYSNLRQLCRSYDIPYAKIANPNAPDFIATLRRRSPDVLVSVACPFILKDAVLSVPSTASINIHHAPLPRYKGMMPTFWQLYHGEPTAGISIHYMVPKVDEGDLLLQEAYPVLDGESLDHLIRRSKRQGAHCMATVLRQISSHSVHTIPLDHSAGSYFTFPTAAEIREFHRRGLRAI